MVTLTLGQTFRFTGLDGYKSSGQEFHWLIGTFSSIILSEELIYKAIDGHWFAI